MQKVCKRRTGRPNVAHIQTISPVAGELFYFHCLLMHCAARGFEDIHMF